MSFEQKNPASLQEAIDGLKAKENRAGNKSVAAGCSTSYLFGIMIIDVIVKYILFNGTLLSLRGKTGA